MRFHNRFKDYATVSFLGLFAGIIARLTDFCSMDTLWSFPTIATLFGFWIVTVTLIIWRSTSHLTAGLNTFLYLLCMTVAYYGLQYLFGLFLPGFALEEFPLHLFIAYCAASAVCGLLAVILYFWNRKSWYAAILLAAPIGVLAAETLSVLVLLQRHQTHLFQLIFNAGFCLYIGLQFRKSTRYKELYTVSVIAFASACYYFLYSPWV